MYVQLQFLDRKKATKKVTTSLSSDSRSLGAELLVFAAVVLDFGVQC